MTPAAGSTSNYITNPLGILCQVNCTGQNDHRNRGSVNVNMAETVN